MDAEYRDLLVAAQKHYQRSWKVWFQNGFFQFCRFLLAATVKSVFLIRDGLIVLVNVFYVALLVPLDIILICLYFLAFYIRNEPYEDPDDLWKLPDTQKAQSKLIDLNVLRRLFWSGAGISIGKRFNTLEAPKTIITTETHLDGTKSRVAKEWVKPSSDEPKPELTTDRSKCKSYPTYPKLLP